ncbi:MAG: DUF3786 domain-containing protein [Eubacteriales bacterium]|nr:DUF3786 domain-containing protein [Eubacteriales bacterium]
MQQESNLTNAYLEAYEKACRRLIDCSAEAVCQNSKAVYEKKTGTYVIRYFDQQYRISCTDGSVFFKGNPAEPTTTEKVLILHYLIHAQPKPLSGKSISFKEVPNGGSIYYPTFKKRAIDPLVKTFSEDLQSFAKAAAALGGAAESFGDVSSTIYAFPYVPVTYVLWQGDEEVPSSGTILFDSSVSYFLPVEDIVLAASFGTYKLIGATEKKKG